MRHHASRFERVSSIERITDIAAQHEVSGEGFDHIQCSANSCKRLSVDTCRTFGAIFSSQAATHFRYDHKFSDFRDP